MPNLRLVLRAVHGQPAMQLASNRGARPWRLPGNGTLFARRSAPVELFEGAAGPSALESSGATRCYVDGRHVGAPPRAASATKAGLRERHCTLGHRHGRLDETRAAHLRDRRARGGAVDFTMKGLDRCRAMCPTSAKVAPSSHTRSRKCTAGGAGAHLQRSWASSIGAGLIKGARPCNRSQPRNDGRPLDANGSSRETATTGARRRAPFAAAGRRAFPTRWRVSRDKVLQRRPDLGRSRGLHFPRTSRTAYKLDRRDSPSCTAKTSR